MVSVRIVCFGVTVDIVDMIAEYPSSGSCTMDYFNLDPTILFLPEVAGLSLLHTNKAQRSLTLQDQADANADPTADTEHSQLVEIHLMVDYPDLYRPRDGRAHRHQCRRLRPCREARWQRYQGTQEGEVPR